MFLYIVLADKFISFYLQKLLIINTIIYKSVKNTMYNKNKFIHQFNISLRFKMVAVFFLIFNFTNEVLHFCKPKARSAIFNLMFIPGISLICVTIFYNIFYNIFYCIFIKLYLKSSNFIIKKFYDFQYVLINIIKSLKSKR